MVARLYRIAFRGGLFSLAPWISIACASCSAADDAPGAQVGPPAVRATIASSAAVSSSPPPPGAGPTPLDGAIAGDWPPRPWSKNVPDRGCANDSECGDGFCDRGTCAPIWTWTQIYGQRCDALHFYHPETCPSTAAGPRCDLMPSCGGYLCLDGRCRSCVSHDECVDLLGPRGECSDPGDSRAGRGCGRAGPMAPVPSVRQ
jgi:hypothetical protein